jgi:uroporphyrinogen-III synthase
MRQAPPFRALITRPRDDAAELADALRQRGVEVAIEPLLVVEPIPDAAIDIVGVQALLLTSANGARAFARLSERRDLPVFAVGDATAATARGLGFATVESAGGDVRDLARLVKDRLDPAGGPLFHAAGSAVAGDLSGLLAETGSTRAGSRPEAKPGDG